MINKQKGNMYPWVTHTWNAIKGKCPHDCSYCYMKVYPQKDVRLDISELKTNLGDGNFIFVGSSCDMWAGEIPDNWIEQTLELCRLHPQNTYLFQSKNPMRFALWECELPPSVLLGTTIESNRSLISYKAPSVYERYQAMKQTEHPKMISIEPIMDFDVGELAQWITEIYPCFVSIGADSKGHNLPEPKPQKIKELISELVKITEVKLKANLKRLIEPPKDKEE